MSLPMMLWDSSLPMATSLSLLHCDISKSVKHPERECIRFILLLSFKIRFSKFFDVTLWFFCSFLISFEKLLVSLKDVYNQSSVQMLTVEFSQKDLTLTCSKTRSIYRCFRAPVRCCKVRRSEYFKVSRSECLMFC